MKTLEKTTILKPVYRLVGNDQMMLDKAIALIEAKAQLQMPELNKAVFNDENFDAEKVILSCQQLPMLSDKRLVVIKNILKIKEAEIKKLEKYCTKPSQETVLVIQENVGENVFSKLTAEKVLCNKLDESELIKIIDQKFIQAQKNITEEAKNMLIDFCSRDLLRVNNELTKLLNCGAENIDADLVKQHVKKSDEYSVFEISTALTYGNGNKALVLLKKMLETMEFPVILGLISSHFRRMLYAVLAEGTNDEIAKYLNVKTFAISKAKTLAQNITPAKILKINNLILDIDYDIKSGKMNAENAMYYLVFQIVAIVKGEV